MPSNHPNDILKQAPVEEAVVPSAEPTIEAPASFIGREGAGAILADRYKLLQPIGEGGMGSVWMADQLEPVKRRVAVKLIRLEQARSRNFLARFEAERQAIALMDHPHIAKLLDAGATEHGSPFFVMDWIKGVPLTEFCQSHKLSLEDRLLLFTQVCSAVQHAHQKGIIHRDLKPTNILVESHEGKPVAKVIDFGLAKAVSGMQLTENTLFTGIGVVAGTPLYMAPEQASLNAVDVDTRTDVYALGVILYELLTGGTPIARETAKQVAFDELLRIVREQEPPTPSSRVSSSELVPVASSYPMDRTALARLIKGDLDWMVMKALSKDRERRYESVHAFAADLQRYLNNEPVEASPPSVRYRLTKFARRHRQALATVSAFSLLLLGATVFSAWLAIRATDAEKNAESDRDLARKAEREAIAQHKLVRTALAFFTDGVTAIGPRQQANPNIKVSDFANELTRQLDADPSVSPVVEATVRRIVGKLFDQIGNYDRAEKELRRADDLFHQTLGPSAEETLTCRGDLAYALAQNLSGSSRKLTEAIDILRALAPAAAQTLGAEHGTTLRAKSNLGWALGINWGKEYKDEHRAEGRKLLEEALAGYQKLDPPKKRDQLTASLNLAQLLWNPDIPEDSRRAEKLARATRSQARAEYGDGSFAELLAASIVARTLWAQNRAAESAAVLEEILPKQAALLGEGHRIVLENREALAVDYLEMGRWADSQRHADRVKSHRLADKTMNNVLKAVYTSYYPAIYLYHQQKYADAEKLFREGLRMSKSSGAPYRLYYTYGIAACRIRLGKPDEGQSLLQEAVHTMEGLQGFAKSYYGRALAHDAHRACDALEAMGQAEEAAKRRRELNLQALPGVK